MNEQQAKPSPDDLIRCMSCSHFSYFDNHDGHNSPHALGRCRAKPWDGNRTQWAMFKHHCKNFMGQAGS